jgi:hypothetical protein
MIAQETRASEFQYGKVAGSHAAQVPLFASSWVALFLQLREHFAGPEEAPTNNPCGG